MAASQVGAKFSGKVALITGASSGIGAATAELFSKMGANLSLTGRNLDNLQNWETGHLLLNVTLSL